MEQFEGMDELEFTEAENMNDLVSAEEESEIHEEEEADEGEN